MKPNYLDSLLSASTDQELAEFISQFFPSTNTIHELKDYTAQLHFSQPDFAVKIAKKTYELSLHMNPEAQALGCWCLGNAYLHSGQYVDAERYLRNARILYLQCGKPHYATQLSVGLVGVMALTGDPQLALQLANEIEPVLAAAAQNDQEELRRWANLILNYGIIYDLMGDYEELISIYQRCIERLINSDELHLGARVRHNRAYVLGQIGAFDEALVEYKQAEELFNAVNSTSDLVRLTINRCYILMALGRYQEAISYEETIRQELAEQSGLDQAAPRLTILRAQLYLSIGRSITQGMIADLHKAEDTFARNGPMSEAGLTWLLLGRCNRQIGHMEDAKRCYREVIHLVENGADRSLEFRAYHGLAGIEEQEQNFSEAISLYETAIDRLEQIRNDLQIETLRASYLSDKLGVYRDLTALYLYLQQLSEAFQVSERSKARLVMEKLEARLTGEISQAVESGDIRLRPLAQQLQREFVILEDTYRAVKVGQMTDLDIADLQRSVAEQEQSVQRLISEIQRQQPIFSTLTTGWTVPVERLQSQLGDAIFLQYHVLGDIFGVFVVTSKGIELHRKLGRISDIVQTYRDFSTAIEGVLGLIQQGGLKRASRRLPGLLAAVNQHLSRLYDFLFEPLVRHLPLECQLVISPDDFLHSIPFHALYDGQSYLVENHTISYAPNATIVDYCEQHAPPDKGALLIGFDDNRLSAIESELQILIQQYPTATVKLGADATTEAFLKHVAHHRLIHVAAHASFRSDKPMLSSITLADRRLTLAEISRQQLHADLITLSGCETGTGQIRGTDVLSLASGFLGAGARSLLVSLWRVEDVTTAQLMAEFYAGIQKGVTYAEALTAAQRSLLTQGRLATDWQRVYQHPLFWAPFFLLGGR